MLNSILIYSSLLLSLFSIQVLSSVAPSTPIPIVKRHLEPINIPIKRRSTINKVQDFNSFLRKAAKTEVRYGTGSTLLIDGQRRKRAAASEVVLTNQDDSEFFGGINIGTPEKSFNVVMDTGSADLVIASSACYNCPPATPHYAAPSSSTSKILGTAFSIIYGTGTASGVLVQDTISIAGIAITGSTFADCNNVNGLLTGQISGLLGLGWKPLSASGTTPLLQAIAQGGNLPEQIFSFALRTYSTIQQFYDQQDGGFMIVGGLNNSYYQGNMNWIPIEQPAAYWKIPLQDVNVNGVNLNISNSGVVIDTGTSLIGGPASDVAKIYASIPGSQPVIYASSSGYYSYPCITPVNVAFKFGDILYSVPNTTFNGGILDAANGTCLGVLFALKSTSSISWIFGDAFLTGVYSAFRFSSPAAVGFALRGTGGTDLASTTSTSTTGSSSSSGSSGNDTSGTRQANTSAAGKSRNIGANSNWIGMVGMLVIAGFIIL